MGPHMTSWCLTLISVARTVWRYVAEAGLQAAYIYLKLSTKKIWLASACDQEGCPGCRSSESCAVCRSPRRGWALGVPMPRVCSVTRRNGCARISATSASPATAGTSSCLGMILWRPGGVAPALHACVQTHKASPSFCRSALGGRGSTPGAMNYEMVQIVSVRMVQGHFLGAGIWTLQRDSCSLGHHVRRPELQRSGSRHCRHAPRPLPIHLHTRVLRPSFHLPVIDLTFSLRQSASGGLGGSTNA